MIGCQVRVFQRRRNGSGPETARVLPSGEKANVGVKDFSSFSTTNVLIRLRLATSNTLTVLGQMTVATVRWSGAAAIAWALPLFMAANERREACRQKYHSGPRRSGSPAFGICRVNKSSSNSMPPSS